MTLVNQTTEVAQKLGEWIDNDPRRIKLLAELIVAIPLTQSVQSGDLAAQIARDVQDQSIAQQLRRFFKNEAITWQDFYLPLLQAALGQLETGPYYVLIDTTELGSTHRAVVMSLSYQQRAIPLIWQVIEGAQGHSPEQVQLELVRRFARHFHFEQPVIFLGDSEFVGVAMQRQVRAQGWYYVLRTSPQVHIYPDPAKPTQSLSLHEVVPQPGTATHSYEAVLYTKQYQYGPVACEAVWEAPHEAPLILIGHLPAEWPKSLRQSYRPRALIEPLFGDCKQGGFRLTDSRLSDSDRLGRLFLSVAAAYLWMVALGTYVLQSHQGASVDRSNRRTLSIFKLGLRWLRHQFKLDKLVHFALDLSFALVLPPLKFL